MARSVHLSAWKRAQGLSANIVPEETQTRKGKSMHDNSRVCPMQSSGRGQNFSNRVESIGVVLPSFVGEGAFVLRSGISSTEQKPRSLGSQLRKSAESRDGALRAFRKATRPKSPDLPLVRYWWHELVCFVSVEDMPKRSIGYPGL